MDKISTYFTSISPDDSDHKVDDGTCTPKNMPITLYCTSHSLQFYIRGANRREKGSCTRHCAVSNQAANLHCHTSLSHENRDRYKKAAFEYKMFVFGSCYPFVTHYTHL